MEVRSHCCGDMDPGQHHYQLCKDYQQVADTLSVVNSAGTLELDHLDIKAAHRIRTLLSSWFEAPIEHVWHQFQSKRQQLAATFPTVNALRCKFIDIASPTRSPHQIEYGCGSTPYGEAFIAWSEDGICQLTFLDPHLLEQENAAHSMTLYDALESLLRRWHGAVVEENNPAAQLWLQKVTDHQFGANTTCSNGTIRLVLKGSEFQRKVWQQLLTIPTAEMTSYGDIAQQIGKPGANQAIGNAVGANPIAWLVPCHRVVRAEGGLGGYRWGLPRKLTLLLHEQSRVLRHNV